MYRKFLIGLFVIPAFTCPVHAANEKHGPCGMEPCIVHVDASVEYSIFFENDFLVPLPVVQLDILDVIDSHLAVETLRFTGFSVGDIDLSIAPTSRLETSVPLDTGMFLHVEGIVDLATRTVTWGFETFDPMNPGGVVDPWDGFLPPNDETHRGEGHVRFTVRIDEEAPNGTSIPNSADIVFDRNDTVRTNPVILTVCTYTGTPDTPAASPAGIDGCCPNPFNPSTTIGFTLSQTEAVTLSVVDLRGRRVAELCCGTLVAGSHRRDWDGRGFDGRSMPSGVYLAVLTTSEGRFTEKLVLGK